MDTVTILRELWRLRLYVVGVCVVAVLAGTAVMYKISFPPKLESRRYEVGVATAHILVDTPNSQVVAVAPRGSDTLGARAPLLASLMIDGVVKSAIAQRAGLQPNQIVGVTDSVTEPSPASGSPVSAPSGPRAFELTTRVLTDTTGDPLPVIEVDAQAPSRAGAARLAGAAIAGVRDYLGSEAALERVSDANRLQLIGLGAPQATTDVRGPSDVIAIVVVILVFLLGCASILGVLAVLRGWRTASAREQLGNDGLLVAEVGPTPPAEPFLDDIPDAPAPARPTARAAEAASDDWLAARRRPSLVVAPRANDTSFLRSSRPVRSVERDAADHS